AGDKLHQVQHAVGVFAGGGDEVMVAHPGAGGIGLGIVAAAGGRRAQRQIVGLGVGIGGGPGGVVEVFVLGGIAEAEVGAGQASGAEVGIGVIEVALHADTAVQRAGLIHLVQLL